MCKKRFTRQVICSDLYKGNLDRTVRKPEAENEVGTINARTPVGQTETLNSSIL